MKPFLCTTALTDFWGPDAASRVFLGPWCIAPYPEEDLPSQPRMVAHPWQNMDDYIRSIPGEERIIDTCLASLSDTLDRVHGVSLGPRYWETVLSPWVYDFVMVLHERYLSIHAALKQYDDAESLIFSRESYWTSGNSKSLARDAVTDDAFNLQLYSIILSTLLPAVKSVTVPFKTVVEEKSSSQRLRSLISDTSTSFALKGRHALLLGGVTLGTAFKFTKYSGLQCRLGLCGDTPVPSRATTTLDWSSRRSLQLYLDVDDQAFSRVLDQALPALLPTVFVEDFSFIRTRALALLGRSSPETIVTSASYHSSDLLRFIIAEARNRGSRLAIAQHGGDYGSSLYCPLEQVESRVADEYWTWGWQCGSAVATRHVPSPKLSELVRLPQTTLQGSILYVANTGGRYYYRKHCFPLAHHMSGYYKRQEEFFEEIPEDFLRKMTFRPYRSSYGWRFTEKLQKRFPALHMDNATNYNLALQKAHLVVCDMNLTTLLERLAIRKPLIACWSPDVFRLRPQAKPLYDGLKSIGILFDSPQKAARALVDLANDIDGWWDACLRSQAYAEFERTFLLHSPHWEREWVSAARKLGAQ